jgi:hypothetical protein
MRESIRGKSGEYVPALFRSPNNCALILIIGMKETMTDEVHARNVAFAGLRRDTKPKYWVKSLDTDNTGRSAWLI